MDEYQRRLNHARHMAQRPAKITSRQPATAQVRQHVAATVVQTQPRGRGIYISFDGIKKKFPKFNITSTALSTALFIALVAAGFYFNRYQNAQTQLKQHNIISPQQQQANKDKIAEAVAKVGKLTTLPQGETPTLAEVTDITKLANQPFFAKAQNGDEVLIYTGAKTAYLYRPSTNQLINVAPVTQGSSSATSTNGSSSSSQTVPTTQTSGH